MDTQQVQTQLSQAQQITRTMTMVEEMHHRLFGNGHPGELAQLDTRITTLDKDVDDLKQSKSQAKGAFWALSGLFTLLGGTQIWSFFFKRG